MVVVPDSACLSETKPVLSSENEVCNVIICPAEWIVNSDWSTVSNITYARGDKTGID